MFPVEGLVVFVGRHTRSHVVGAQDPKWKPRIDRVWFAQRGASTDLPRHRWKHDPAAKDCTSSTILSLSETRLQRFATSVTG